MWWSVLGGRGGLLGCEASGHSSVDSLLRTARLDSFGPEARNEAGCGRDGGAAVLLGGHVTGQRVKVGVGHGCKVERIHGFSYAGVMTAAPVASSHGPVGSPLLAHTGWFLVLLKTHTPLNF